MFLNSLIFGAFVGSLTDYWLGRFGVKDLTRLAVAVAVGVIIGVFVYVGKVAYF